MNTLTQHLPLSTSLRLTTGHSLALMLARGDELFCIHGPLLLSTSPMSGIEGTPNLQIRLHSGQSWRAPCMLAAQVTALQSSGQLRYYPAPAAMKAGITSTTTPWWLRLHAGITRVWPRRLLR
jgi:hypothetical protein